MVQIVELFLVQSLLSEWAEVVEKQVSCINNPI